MGYTTMTVKKDTIVQFVGFVTDLGLDEFAPKWEHYAKRFMSKKTDSTLQEQVPANRNKFRFVSKHEWADRDFHFSFMNEKKSEHFPEHNVRVVQTGGYIPLHTKKRSREENDDTRLIAFISHDENDIDYYRRIALYRHLEIYQAYYESCTYGYVLEFFVPEADAGVLLLLLKQRPGVEAGIYKDCLVPHV